MYFKKLELTGFKSFREKTELDFQYGITAIVGPNGCGKSNISDSIRWVLGEQRPKELRGAKMEDVIFNGTRNQEPSNVAEVSLTISNEKGILPVEYQEVTITRRAFRTGESEYFINKNQVRLKDISEMLMGTGIGTDSYSLIGQGKVDLILSSRPEERRFIFEEASGITKYKTKKKEAIRKLERTQDNLTRLNDIIHELEKQIKSIERQAKKAEKYKVLYEKLKKLEVKVAILEYSDMENIHKNCLSTSSLEKDNQNQLNEELLKLREELEEKTRLQNQLIAELSALKEEDASVKNHIEANNNRINFNNERIEELKKRRINIEDELKSLKIKIVELKQQVDMYKVHLDTLSTQLNAKKDEYTQKDNTLSGLNYMLKNSENIISQDKLRLMDVEVKHSKNKNELTGISTNIQNYNLQLSKVITEHSERKKELEYLENNLGIINININNILNELRTIREEREHTLNKLTEVKKELTQASETLAETRNRSASTLSTLDFLEDLKRRMEGYSNGVKAILQGYNGGGIIYGALANLVEVEIGYEIPVEVILEEHVQNIIVDNQHTALDAISYLAQHNTGRATFIPLTDIDTENAYTLTKEEETVLAKIMQENELENLMIGKAINFVKTENKFKPVLEYLLGVAYLVKDLEAALRFARVFNYYGLGKTKNVRFITLKGEVVCGNKISGGVIGLDVNTSLIGRDAKIKRTRESYDELRNAINNLEHIKQDKIEVLSRLENAVSNIETQLQQKEIALNNAQSTRANIEAQKNKLADDISVLNKEIDQINKDLNTFKENQEKLTQEITTLELEKEALQKSLTENEEVLNIKGVEKETIIVEVTELKTQIASLAKEEESRRNTLSVFSRSLTEQENLFHQREEELIEAEKKIETLDKNSKNLKQELAVLEDTTVEIKEKLEKACVNKTEVESVLNYINTQITTKQNELNDIKEKLHSFDIKATEVSFHKNRIKDRINEVYNIDIENISDEQREKFLKEEIIDELENDITSSIPCDNNTKFNIEDAKEKIEILKTKTSNMGNINLDAISEHKELNERFKFLSEQREDLVNARADLYKAIEKINKTTQIMFIETFNQIQGQFKEFFRLLFGGGEAEIILVDESNVLDSGIDIIASPPGKKLQNISLLSGGEKAMTAIALIFAIFKVKPSPFCVLDEIDAPLDDANVERLSRMLEEFSKISQFIIITHNKKTIKLANVMYGVTMQESGVSGLVSVKFDDKLEADNKVN